MPSPFPGMDPFIESQEWPDFHHAAIEVMREFLTDRVGTRYIVRVERRVYLEHTFDDQDRLFIPDVSVILDSGSMSGAVQSSATATLTAVAPVECIVPMIEEQRESFLYIRDRETKEVITVLELLSPTNKRLGSDGHKLYLEKRQEVLDSQSHLVELDLLRGGERVPLRGNIPAGDYLAVVSRAKKRPRVAVYAWPLRRRLPTIPVPLKAGDPDVPLDLQAVLDTVYDRARYNLSLNYQAAAVPPLAAEDAEWAKGLIGAHQPPR